MPGPPLASRSFREFPRQDRERGESYLDSGRVIDVEPILAGLVALVQGSRRTPYEVVLDWSRADRGILGVDCDCPRFVETERCKHVWASVRTADEQGFDGDVPGTAALEVVTLDEDSPIWDEFEPELPSPAAGLAEWRSRLAKIAQSQMARVPVHRTLRPLESRRREIYYVIDPQRCLAENGLVISLRQREERADGTMGVLKRLSVDRQEIRRLPDPEDRELFEILHATASGRRDRDEARSAFRRTEGSDPRLSEVAIPGPYASTLLSRLAATGRLLLRHEDRDRADLDAVLVWDEGPPWKLEIAVEPPEEGRGRIVGSLVRHGERIDLAEPELLLAGGIVVLPDRVARLDAGDHFAWIAQLRERGSIEVPEEELSEAIAALHELPSPPPLNLPPDIEVRAERHRPRPRFDIHRPPEGIWPRSLRGVVVFRYDSTDVEPEDPRGAIATGDRLLLRDRKAEEEAFEKLAELGLEPSPDHEPTHCLVPEPALPRVVEHLIALGWEVFTAGDSIRRTGATRLRVSSGVDWFDLSGTVEIGSEHVPFPALLRAARDGHRFLRLDDGSVGLLPEEWLQRYGSLARLAHEETDDGLRFEPSQGLLLDTLLAELPAVDVDATFAAVRKKIRSFEGFEPAEEPRGFRGELRPYQKEGLGWLLGLQELEMGGCLADDMGLGKTVQVLALLQWRRARPVPREEKRPSIVVAPRSLVFNWIEEAARFAPRLRVLDYTGTDRDELRERFPEHDLVVTTYGTLLRDVAHFDGFCFDVAVLDEAQAIKNPSTQRAKACRLLRADHRLTLTGTPVENHLGDLWSIFEFLNPGLLGKLGRENLAGRTPKSDQEEIEKLSRALSPFILRRKKEEVVEDLPPKTEQVLWCELTATQRRLYDELRDHYRASLSGHVEQKGLARSKIHVLEALLRLRQAACHPGLVDPDRKAEGSGKLDQVLEQVEEVLDEGHKALVFSQFTTMLGIVRHRIDERGIPYEYLDGSTRKRQERVERFQNDPDCRLFLVSLKAGGVGLNLTAADYVYLLDPWWNPAVETQAIDRTHRIGQTRPVFAYRLIARDTVEEKILRLQKEKRELADAIFTGDESLMRRLTVEDLEALMG